MCYSLYDLEPPHNSNAPSKGDIISVSGLAYPRYEVMAIAGEEMWLKDTSNGRSSIARVTAYSKILQKKEDYNSI